VFEATIREYGPDCQQLGQGLVAFIVLKLFRFESDEERAVRVAKYTQSMIFPLGISALSKD
jgi:hypothetical protein